MSETTSEHEKEAIATADAPSTAPPKEVSSPQVPGAESNGLRLLKAIKDKTWVGLVLVLPDPRLRRVGRRCEGCENMGPCVVCRGVKTLHLGLPRVSPIDSCGILITYTVLVHREAVGRG